MGNFGHGRMGWDVVGRWLARWEYVRVGFHSIGAFEANSHDFEGDILFETMMIARAVTWLATLSVDPNAETRRGVLSVFSELRAAYRASKRFVSCIFVITMRNNFWRKEFVAR